VSVVVGNAGNELDVYDSKRIGPPTTLSLGGNAGLDGFNAHTADLYQPPAGRRVLSLSGDSARPALTISDADGTNERVLIDAARSDYSFIYLGQPKWSPDGSMIAFVGAQRDVAEDYLSYVMNADGSGLRPLSKSTHPINESNPAWSPDGTRIALQRWNVDVNADQQEPRPITVIDVKTGDEVEVGDRPVTNGFQAWGWSPDGQSILELPVPEQLIVADVATGQPRTMTWGTLSGPSWQRLAP
jgi:Tol biopolymer transport system component